MDPANFTDPTGNFGLGGFFAAARVQGVLRAASIADTGFEIFSLANDEDGLTSKEVGLLLITSLGGGKILKLLRRGCNSFDYDGLGSTRALSNDAGGLTNSYDYDAFGEVLNQTGTTENNYLFTGEQFDSNLDQYYLRARYYDQGIGRFTQMDTWMWVNSDPVTLHKYLYANVEPVNFTDPTGNFGLGSFGAAARVNGILSAVSIGQTAFDVFSAATDEDGLTAKELGFLVLASLSPAKITKLFRRKGPGGCKNSFDGETLVATENGLRPISEIEIGDKVWAYNEETREKSLQEVTHLIFGEGEKELIDITLINGEVLTTTTTHPFYVDNTWLDAGKIVSGNNLLGLSDGSIGVKLVKSYDQKLNVYNLTVANEHNYYVGSSEALVHNCPVGRTPDIVRRKVTIQQCLSRTASGKCKTGWEHVLDRHFGRSAGGSRFSIGSEELRHLLRSQRVVASPAINLGANRFLREVRLNNRIGRDKFNGNKKTNILTVIVNDKGELLSTFPGKLK